MSLSHVLLLILLAAAASAPADEVASADAHFRAREFDAAEKAYKRLVASGTRVAHVYSNLARIYDEEHRGGAFTDEAEALHRRAVELDPASGSAWFLFGMHLFGEGRRDDAIAALRKAAALPGEHGAETHYRLARLLGGGADPAELERLYRKAIALRPSYAAPHFFLGRLLANVGRRSEAVAILKKGSTLPHQGDERLDFDDEIHELEEAR